LAGLWDPFGGPGTYRAWLKFIKIPTVIDERGCNLTSKPTIMDERGENLNNIIDIKYRHMFQVRETVFKSRRFGICREHVWHIYIYIYIYIWNYGICMERIRICIEEARNTGSMHGAHVEYMWNMDGIPMEYIWNACGTASKYTEHVWSKCQW